MKTSASDPIRVDFVAADALGHAGRLGLTFAPGKKASGATAQWSRDLVTDLERLRDEYATHTLVTLMQDYELSDFGIADLFTRAADVGIATLRLPITDGSIPRNDDALRELVASILALTKGGANVVVHCKGGLGRSGLVAACCLVAAGHPPSAAIRIVRAARHRAVETEEQERYVHSFGRRA